MSVRELKQQLRQAVDATWYGISDPMTGQVPAEVCLPMCVLMQRVLSVTAPNERLHLRLGALSVIPTDPVHVALGPKRYDPRDSADASSGFHAWLESADGVRVDPSILITLSALGYRVDDEDLLAFDGNLVEHRGLQLLYEHTPDLRVVGIEASEPALAQHLRRALYGAELTSNVTIHLNVEWPAKETAARMKETT